MLHNFDSQGHEGLKLLLVRSKSVFSHDGTWTRSLRISSICVRSPTRYHCATRDWLYWCNYILHFNSMVTISELTFGIVLGLGICYLWCHLTMRTPRNRTYNSNRIKLCDVFMRFEKYITLARSRLIFLSLCGVMRIISLLWLDILLLCDSRICAPEGITQFRRKKIILLIKKANHAHHKNCICIFK